MAARAMESRRLVCMVFLVLKFENLHGLVLAAIPHELVGEGEQGEVGQGI